MYANKGMRLCYGKAPGKLCRMCQSWKCEYCKKTNRKKKCPAWGATCMKFQENESTYEVLTVTDKDLMEAAQCAHRMTGYADPDGSLLNYLSCHGRRDPDPPDSQLRELPQLPHLRFHLKQRIPYAAKIYNELGGRRKSP